MWTVWTQEFRPTGETGVLSTGYEQTESMANSLEPPMTVLVESAVSMRLTQHRMQPKEDQVLRERGTPKKCTACQRAVVVAFDMRELARTNAYKRQLGAAKLKRNSRLSG